MRPARLNRCRGRCPLTPRDIWTKMKEAHGQMPFIFAANIPAGGSDATYPRHARGPGAQNSFFKNFDGPRAQA